MTQLTSEKKKKKKKKIWIFFFTYGPLKISAF